MQHNGFEIERKFLVADSSWQSQQTASFNIVQGYLRSHEGCKGIRVRVMGAQGFLTLKGRRIGMTCEEQETEIPVNMAESLLCSAEAIIEKTRHHVPFDGMLWEVDVFHGANEGLIMAEVELEHEDQVIRMPDWLGSEVTLLKKYSNRKLAHPVRDLGRVHRAISSCKKGNA